MRWPYNRENKLKAFLFCLIFAVAKWSCTSSLPDPDLCLWCVFVVVFHTDSSTSCRSPTMSDFHLPVPQVLPDFGVWAITVYTTLSLCTCFSLSIYSLFHVSSKVFPSTALQHFLTLPSQYLQFLLLLPARPSQLVPITLLISAVDPSLRFPSWNQTDIANCFPIHPLLLLLLLLGDFPKQ